MQKRDCSIELKRVLSRTKVAKHLRITNQLQGEIRRLVFYLYKEIIDVIENGRISKRSNNAQILVFRVEIRYDSMYVYTKHVLAEKVAYFNIKEYSKDEVISAIESAMNVAGLNVKVEKEGRVYIYIPVKTEEEL